MEYGLKTFIQYFQFSDNLNAVELFGKTEKIGYLRRNIAAHIEHLMDHGTYTPPAMPQPLVISKRGKIRWNLDSTLSAIAHWRK